MKDILMFFGAICIVVISMFLRNAYDMNKQCDNGGKYYSLGMELDCD